jgi:RNA recognition motif-containing protein
MNIYVGNLNYKVREEEIESIFAEYGEVNSVKIIKDRETGRSKGFAFVEMPNNEEGQQAIDALHETEFQQRNLVVNEARPQSSENRGGGSSQRDNRRRY